MQKDGLKTEKNFFSKDDLGNSLFFYILHTINHQSKQNRSLFLNFYPAFHS